MQLASMSLVSLCALAFVGCTITGPEIKGPEIRVKPPVEVTVEQDKDHDGRDGRFCPPGQAKKGRC